MPHNEREAAAGDDQHLISTCDAIVVLEREQSAILAGHRSLEDEQRDRQQLQNLDGRLNRLLETVSAARTTAGAAAVARAAWAMASRDADGTIICGDPVQRLAWLAVEFLAGRAA